MVILTIPPGKPQEMTANLLGPMIFNSDKSEYGGYARLVEGQMHHALTQPEGKETQSFLQLYLPTRTALVLQPNLGNHKRKTPLDTWIDFV